MIRVTTFVLCFASFQLSFALDQSKCSKMLNDGWFKKYEYGGVDQPLTKATKKVGLTKATFVTSTEGSTASSDPGYWSNVTTSETQFTSSWGSCSAIALEKIKENRDQYFAQNKNRILHEIAVGKGEHLRVLASYSLCEDNYFDRLGFKLQENMSSFLENSIDSGVVVDSIVRNDVNLSKACHSYN